MLDNYNILAKDEDGIGEIVFFLVIVTISIVSSIIKKMKEKAAEQRKSQTMPLPKEPPKTQPRQKPAVPHGVSARDVLQRRRQAYEAAIARKSQQQTHPTRIRQPQKTMPSTAEMAGEAILIPDEPRKVVSNKIQTGSRKISKVARRHMAAKVAKRHIKAKTEKTKVIPAKMPQTSTIEEIRPVKGIRELISDRDALRKAFVVHEILMEPKSLR